MQTAYCIPRMPNVLLSEYILKILICTHIKGTSEFPFLQSLTTSIGLKNKDIQETDFVQTNNLGKIYGYLPISF